MEKMLYKPPIAVECVYDIKNMKAAILTKAKVGKIIVIKNNLDSWIGVYSLNDRTIDVSCPIQFKYYNSNEEAETNWLMGVRKLMIHSDYYAEYFRQKSGNRRIIEVNTNLKKYIEKLKSDIAVYMTEAGFRITPE